MPRSARERAVDLRPAAPHLVVEVGERLQFRVREQAPWPAREALVAAFAEDSAGGVGQHRADRDAPVAVRLPGRLDRGAPRRVERAP